MRWQCRRKVRVFYFYPRIIDKRTVLNIVDFPLLIKSGISIDIFPLVALGDNLDQAREKMDCAVEEQKYIKHMISLRTSTEEIQKRLEQFWTEKLDVDYLATKYCGNIFGPYGEREILESHIFKNIVPLQFEDDNFYGPKEYDSYLRAIYGNYLEYPPEDKRVKFAYMDRLLDLGGAWHEKKIAVILVGGQIFKFLPHLHMKNPRASFV